MRRCRSKSYGWINKFLPKSSMLEDSIYNALIKSRKDNFPTIEDLRKFILEYRPTSKFEIKADTISQIY